MAYTLQIGVKTAFGLDIGMADQIANLRSLATESAALAHEIILQKNRNVLIMASARHEPQTQNRVFHAQRYLLKISSASRNCKENSHFPQKRLPIQSPLSLIAAVETGKALRQQCQ